MRKKGGGRKVGIDERFEVYRKVLGGLSKEMRDFVELFRPAVRMGIESATKWDKTLESLDSYDEKKECLEYDELLFFIPLIMEAYNTIFTEDSL